jgi:hypothetical protein
VPFKDPEIAREKHRERSRKRYARIKADPALYAAELLAARSRRQRPERKEKTRAYRRRVAQTEKGKRQACLHQRKVRLKRRGLTPEEYDAKLAAQGGRCAICGTDKPARGGGNYSFPVDHCHTTGKTRGLLCHHCNVTLGRFADDPVAIQEWAERARSYLEYFLLQT